MHLESGEIRFGCTRRQNLLAVLGWVGLDPIFFSLVLGWVGLGQSADGLGWIGSHRMDRWTALVSPGTAAVHCSVVQILSRKQSVPSGDCRGHSGAYVFRVVPTLGGRRTTDTTTAYHRHHHGLIQLGHDVPPTPPRPDSAGRTPGPTTYHRHGTTRTASRVARATATTFVPPSTA